MENEVDDLINQLLSDELLDDEDMQREVSKDNHNEDLDINRLTRIEDFVNSGYDLEGMSLSFVL